MRKLLTALLFFLLPGVAFTGPFLICDPQPGVETYQVYQDNVLLSDNVAAQTDGSLKYDLKDITPGKYSFTSKACAGPWGCSTLSDPFVSPEPVSKPTGMRLTK